MKIFDLNPLLESAHAALAAAASAEGASAVYGDASQAQANTMDIGNESHVSPTYSHLKPNSAGQAGASVTGAEWILRALPQRPLSPGVMQKLHALDLAAALSTGANNGAQVCVHVCVFAFVCVCVCVFPSVSSVLSRSARSPPESCRSCMRWT